MDNTSAMRELTSTNLGLAASNMGVTASNLELVKEMRLLREQLSNETESKEHFKRAANKAMSSPIRSDDDSEDLDRKREDAEVASQMKAFRTAAGEGNMAAVKHIRKVHGSAVAKQQREKRIKVEACNKQLEMEIRYMEQSRDVLNKKRELEGSEAQDEIDNINKELYELKTRLGSNPTTTSADYDELMTKTKELATKNPHLSRAVKVLAVEADRRGMKATASFFATSIPASGCGADDTWHR